MNAACEVEVGAAEEAQIALREHAELEYRNQRHFDGPGHVYFISHRSLPGYSGEGAGGYLQVDGKQLCIESLIGSAGNLSPAGGQGPGHRVGGWRQGVD